MRIPEYQLRKHTQKDDNVYHVFTEREFSAFTSCAIHLYAAQIGTRNIKLGNKKTKFFCENILKYVVVFNLLDLVFVMNVSKPEVLLKTLKKTIVFVTSLMDDTV